MLPISDFPGAATESQLLGGAFQGAEEGRQAGPVGTYITTCEFIPPEASEEDPEPRGGGALLLEVYKRSVYEHTSGRNLLQLGLWPASTPRHPVNVGTRAIAGYDEGSRVWFAEEQVRNDLVTIMREEPTNDESHSFLTLLHEVDDALCGCR